MSSHKLTITNTYPYLFYKGNKFLITLSRRTFYHDGDPHRSQNKYALEKAFDSHTTVLKNRFF